MSSTLKERFFVQSFWDELATNLTLIIPDFNGRAFQKSVCNADWTQLELKQRIRRVAVMLRPQLPQAYPDAIAKLVTLAQHRLDHRSSGHGFAFLFLADFIEEFGLDHLEASVAAIPVITQVMSCEFAVRPFLIRYPKEMMAQMLAWTSHPNEHVRRLASEGSRPRLPWGVALQFLKKDPTPCIPILEKLKNDSSEYVRRSVANHLNDISKDHPAVALKIAQQWIGKNKETDKLLKHALRGLLKAGNETALGLFGFVALKNVAVKNLRCQPSVHIGGDWEFSFELVVGGSAAQHLRLEFGIDYMKANGKANRKIFQLREATFTPGTYPIAKRHSFLERTTRKHHLGRHAVAVLVNGNELGVVEFDVVG
ncbi:MAG TPA: DNA alkylation repair protein [Bacteroidia bacterium]|nr:DNA alkylation repair protein [Bacteroidia bacterium]